MSRYGPVIDHLDNKFETIAEMCEYHGINLGTFNGRRRSRWGLEKALTEPVASKPNRTYKGIQDHKGNIFPTKKAMLAHYEVHYILFTNRTRKGWSLEECLTGKKNSVYDHLGNAFKTEKELCSYHNVDRNIYQGCKKHGYSIEQCLGLIPVFNQRTKDFEICDNMVIHHNIAKSDYFLCTLFGKETILHYDDIVDYYRTHILQIGQKGDTSDVSRIE